MANERTPVPGPQQRMTHSRINLKIVSISCADTSRKTTTNLSLFIGVDKMASFKGRAARGWHPLPVQDSLYPNKPERRKCPKTV